MLAEIITLAAIAIFIGISTVNSNEYRLRELEEAL